ncbi:undecaprenyl-diphosphatase UppP [Methanocaldococcus infernus]
MTIIDIIIVSMVEGLTEFLPISSTAHLIVVSKILNIAQTPEYITFEIVIQLSALLALIYRYKDYKDLNIWKKVFLAFLPIAFTGFLFHKIIFSLFSSILIVVFTSIIWGLIFIVVEKIKKEKIKSLEEVNYKEALIIGIFQTFSLIPGTSRSGSTIVGGLLLGLKREVATEFSFLLAIPTMTAATAFTIYKNVSYLTVSDINIIILGSLLSFITALISIKLFLKYVKNHSLILFGIYRIVFGILCLFLLI